MGAHLPIGQKITTWVVLDVLGEEVTDCLDERSLNLACANKM